MAVATRDTDFVYGKYRPAAQNLQHRAISADSRLRLVRSHGRHQLADEFWVIGASLIDLASEGMSTPQ